MADPKQVLVCAGGCGNEFTVEEMTELDGGMYQCDECMGSVILRGSMDEIVPLEDDLPTLPGEDPDEGEDGDDYGSSAA